MSRIHNPYWTAGSKPVFRRGGSVGCLCLHGFSAAPAEIQWLADHLHTTLNLTTYTPRLAGHGTDYRDMDRLTWREWYMSARDGYQLLRDQCETVFVAGISMGGLLALLLAAAEDVDPAATAVLAAPTHYHSRLVPRTRYLKYIRRWSYTPDRTRLPQLLREEQHRRGEPVIGRTSYPIWSVRAVAQLNELSAVVRAHLFLIQTPLALIYAQNDTAVPLECSDYIARYVRSEIVEQHTLHTSGHIITQDVERDRAFERVETFFRRMTPNANRQ